MHRFCIEQLWAVQHVGIGTLSSFPRFVDYPSLTMRSSRIESVFLYNEVYIQFMLISQLKWLLDKNVPDIVDCLGVGVTEEEGSLDIVRESLEFVRVESLPQSRAENITCSHDWEGMVAQQYECKGIINTNYARIASIEEDMRLLRKQMKNYWREGSRMGEAGTSMGMGRPNMGDVGHSMG